MALITASTTTPGASASSSAASRVMTETKRCGPAWISTWATTLSFTTRVTMPTKRFRVDWARGLFGCRRVRGVDRRLGEVHAFEVALAVARRLSSLSRPASAQRRMVSVLTPEEFSGLGRAVLCHDLTLLIARASSRARIAAQPPIIDIERAGRRKSGSLMA